MEIELKNISYIYNPNTANEVTAVNNISLKIHNGESIALMGGTGSGKSTLIQMLNGLKKPSGGSILYDGTDIGTDKKQLCALRCRIGLVFQYPEYQLFDETVLKDVSFGPKNKGCSSQEAEKQARLALTSVGIDEALFGKSPFDLSGGEKRRVAIAGIIAMEPEVLILDEPTAGLDPAGKIEILDLVKKLHDERNMTIIMVSHNMDEAAEYADRIIIMKNGSVVKDGPKHEIFSCEDDLKNAGLSLPQAAMLCRKLGIDGPITIQEAADAISAAIMTK